VLVRGADLELAAGEPRVVRVDARGLGVDRGLKAERLPALSRSCQ